jgi:hypothetical protein
MRVAHFRRSCVRAAAPVVAFLQTLAREVFVALITHKAFFLSSIIHVF